MVQQKREIFIIAMLGSFIGPFTGSSVNVALPALGRELGMNTLMLSWVQLAYLLTVAMLILPIGRMADLMGRKRVLTAGTLLFAATSLSCSLSSGAAALILSRIAQGVSGAAVGVAIVAMVSSAFPAGERGGVLGLTAAATYTGLSLGPFLGGLLTTHWGWRSVFWVILPVCAVMVVLLATLRQEWRETDGKRFDRRGAVIYSLGLLALMGGLTMVHRLPGVLSMLLGMGALALFARYEAGIENPMLDLRLLRENPVVLYASVAALINYCATFSVGYLLSLQMQAGMGYTAGAAGMVLVAQPLVQAFVSPLAGRLSDRKDPGVVASAGMGVTTLGLVLFAVLPPESIGLTVAVLALLGLGLSLFVSPNTNAIMSAVEKKHYGAASGLLGTARAMGQAFSMGITALIMTLVMGDVPIAQGPRDLFITSYRLAFAVMAALCFIGIFTSLARRRSNLPDRAE